MDQNLSSMSDDSQPSSKMAMWILLSVVLTALIVGGGIYMMQTSVLSKTEKDFQAKIDTLQSKVAKLEAQKAPAVTKTTDSTTPQNTNNDSSSAQNGNKATQETYSVKVSPTLEASKDFGVYVNEKSIGTIKRTDLSSLTRQFTRNNVTFLGFAPYGIGGATYFGSDEVWEVNPATKTMKKISFRTPSQLASPTSANAISSDASMLGLVAKQAVAHSSNFSHWVVSVQHLDNSNDTTLFLPGDIDYGIGDMLFSPDGTKIAVQAYYETSANLGCKVFVYTIQDGTYTIAGDTKGAGYLTVKEWKNNSEVTTTNDKSFLNKSDF